MSPEIAACIRELQDNHIITTEFAEALSDSEDVNFIDAHGRSALYYILKANSLTFMKKWVRLGGNVNFLVGDHSLLHVAVGHRREEITHFLLETMANPLHRNLDGRNALHYACEIGSRSMVKLLKENKHFSSHLEDKDLYGQTALEIAGRYQHDEVIKILKNDLRFDCESLPFYGVRQPNISQEKLNPLLERYLISQRKDPERYLCQGGNCNGWSFMHARYTSKQKRAKFFKMLDAITKWDGEVKSLSTYVDINGKRRPLKDIFEKVSTMVSRFQASQKEAEELGLCQGNREDQYFCVSANQGRELNSLFQIPKLRVANRLQLIELLILVQLWRGVSVDIKNSGHIVSVDISPEGLFSYYDSNLLEAIPPMTSLEKLATCIQSGLGNPDGTLDLSFKIHKFKKKNEPLSAYPNFSNATNFPNCQFTPLHLAVIKNNWKEAQTIALKTPSAILISDAFGFTPLHWAIFNDTQFISLFLNILSDRNLLNALDNEAFLNRLFRAACALTDIRIFEEFLGFNHETFDIPSILEKISCTPYNTVMTKFVKTVMQNCKVDPNVVFPGKSTPLLAAVKNNNLELAEFLLLKGANPDLMNKEKESPFDLAVGQGKIEMVKLFFQKGKFISFPDWNSWLGWAVSHHHSSLVEPLLARGANVNTVYNHLPLLLWAIEGGDEKIVQELLENGANKDTKNDCDLTALMWAAAKGRYEMVQLLLTSGADPTLKDRDGHDAASFGSSYPMIVDLIKQAQKQRRGLSFPQPITQKTIVVTGTPSSGESSPKAYIVPALQNRIQALTKIPGLTGTLRTAPKGVAKPAQKIR